jgi:hypothetical protein
MDRNHYFDRLFTLNLTATKADRATELVIGSVSENTGRDP